jgi:heme/copper-type cytochrome/quinol oxidase subunit 2
MYTEAVHTFRPGTWRRWFAFVGGGIAWTFHLLAIYAIGEFGCVSGFDQKMYSGISGVAWLLILVSGLSILPAIGATCVGFVDARRDRRQAEHSPNDEGERYLSSFGWPLNALFVLIIFVESLPVFAYLGGC